jgi:hypothetical protein
MSSQWEVIETTIAKASAKLARRGFGPGRTDPCRRTSHIHVAAGLTNDDIDRVIKQAQKDVAPLVV